MKGGNMPMMKYETPQSVIIWFEEEDIITASGYDEGSEEI
jgi:hypothetical protein